MAICIIFYNFVPLKSYIPHIIMIRFRLSDVTKSCYLSDGVRSLRLYFMFLFMGLTQMMSAQTGDLQRTTPESQGLSSKMVMQMIDTLMAQTDTDVHGIMVMRHGKVVAEKFCSPWAAPYGHTLYSCSKTFTAVAVGLAIGDSLLTLDTKMADVLTDVMPAVPGDSMAQITVRDLLTMRSGLPVDTEMRNRTRDWMRTYLSKGMVGLPGTLFAYDSIDSYLLAAMVQRVTGRKMMDYLRERVFGPMHITQAYWEESPEGISCGGWGLYLQLESMAKFGQLLLNRGAWGGRQLVPAEWVDQMLTKHVDVPNGTKYGYHIWQCPYPSMWRADGAYGQYIFVMPQSDMVVAITQCMRGNGNKEMSWINRLASSAAQQSLSADPLAQKVLAEREYAMPFTKGKESSSRHSTPFMVDLGTNDLGWRRIECFPSKQQFRIKVTTTTGRTFDLNCGHQQWQLNCVDGMPLNFRVFKNNFSNIPEPFLVSCSYGWTTTEDLYLRLNFVNWLSSCRLHLNLKKGQESGDILSSYTNKTVGIKVYPK